MKLAQKIKTHFVFNNALQTIMSLMEKYGRARQVTDDNK
jgi:hypothetical protein